MEFITKYIAKRFWKELKKIDSMPSVNIDQLCAKSDAISKIRTKFDRLPATTREFIGNTRYSEL